MGGPKHALYPNEPLGSQLLCKRPTVPPSFFATMAGPMYNDPDDLTARANAALSSWPVPRGARATLINLSENATFLVEADSGFKAVLRLHRPGYHRPTAITSELHWMGDLRTSRTIQAPTVVMGKDGNAIQMSGDWGLYNPCMWVLFDFVPGDHPDASGDLRDVFTQLGTIAARCHRRVENWSQPEAFERPHWNIDAVFGPDASWGDWRDAPGVTPDVRSVLEQTETRIRARLDAFGALPERFNLIHADMRLANLLVTDGKVTLIDFDDCGFGWFMYEFAASISFMEDDARVPDLKQHWLRGYTAVRALSKSDISEIPTFIMMRRMALLAWIGSHMDSCEPRALAPTFAATTAQLAQNWLEGRSSW